MSRSVGWSIYPWVRMADIAGRWSVYDRKRSAECNQKRRLSDEQYGRRSADITSPSRSGSLHIHWLPVALVIAWLLAIIMHLIAVR